MKRLIAVPVMASLALAAVIGSALAESHEDKALAAAVEARHHQMQLFGYSMGILGAMAKGEADYDSAKAAAAANNIMHVAKLDPSIMWVAGTVQGEISDSRAKADIWSNAEGFRKALETLQTASADLAAAAGTDLDALKGAIGPVGKTCGDCHDTFRGPKN